MVNRGDANLVERDVPVEAEVAAGRGLVGHGDTAIEDAWDHPRGLVCRPFQWYQVTLAVYVQKRSII